MRAILRLVATLTRIRVWLILFVVGLVLSGLTAFPLEVESRLLAGIVGSTGPDFLVAWVDRVHEGIAATNRQYPFMAYGTDWLAFAHLVIAVAFWGAIKDPLGNVWVVQFGMIACAGVIPLALIAGPIRGIPWGWRLVDMSFGVFGIVPLVMAYRLIRRLPVSPQQQVEADRQQYGQQQRDEDHQQAARPTTERTYLDVADAHAVPPGGRGRGPVRDQRKGTPPIVLVQASGAVCSGCHRSPVVVHMSTTYHRK
jgi:hypothetical protein